MESIGCKGINLMIKDSVEKIRKLVNGFDGLVPTIDIQSILMELGVIQGYFQHVGETKVQRIHFPKLFSVKLSKDYVSLEEQTPSQTTFCTESQYELISDAVVSMQARGENFDRWTLQEEVNKTDSRVTIPAILVCLHYWLSMSDPLLVKKEALFAIDCDPDEFVEYANGAWDEVNETPLRIGR